MTTQIERDEETKRRVSAAMKGIPMDLRAQPSEPVTRKPLGPHNLPAEASKKEMTQVEIDEAIKQKYRRVPMLPVESQSRPDAPKQLVAPPSPARSVSSVQSDKKPSPMPNFRPPTSPKWNNHHSSPPKALFESPGRHYAPSSLVMPSPCPSSNGSRDSAIVYPRFRRTSSPQVSPLLEHSPIELASSGVRRASDSALPLLPTAGDLERGNDTLNLPPQAFASPQRKKQLGELRKQRISLPPQALSSPNKLPPSSSSAAQKHRLGDRKQRMPLPPNAVKMPPPATIRTISNEPKTIELASVSVPHHLGEKKTRTSLPPAALTTAAGAAQRPSDRKQRISLPPSALANTSTDQAADQRVEQRASLPGAHAMDCPDPARHRKLGEKKANRVSLPNGGMHQRTGSNASILSSYSEEAKEEVSAPSSATSTPSKRRSSFTEQSVAGVGAFFVPATALSNQDMEERTSFRLRRPSGSSVASNVPSLPGSRPGSCPGTPRSLQQHDSWRDAIQSTPVGEAEFDVSGLQFGDDPDIEVGEIDSTCEPTSVQDASAPMSLHSAPMSLHSSPGRRGTVVKKRKPKPEIEDEVKPKKKGCCNAPWWCNIIVPLILAGFVAVMVALMAKGFKKTNEEEKEGAPARVTLPPTKSEIVVLFEDESMAPATTLTAFETASSPQSKAREWLLADPNAWNYTQSRKLQRFALATLYYAAGGPRWQNSSGWLDYEVHECLWFSAKVQLTRPTDVLLEANRNEAALIPAEKLTTCNMDLEYEYLLLAGDTVRGTIPPEISFLTSLKQLNMESNKIFGSIPSEIALLTNLQSIGLSLNELEGPIPTELGRLSDSLERLYLRDNRLIGALPSELAQLTGLKDLHVANNALSSTIPPVIISNLDQLETLRLGGNKLTGPIPSELGLLKKLTQVNLSNNQLFGTIPSELGSLPELTLFGIAKNPQLDSTIPTEFAKLSKLDTFFATSAGLRGTIPTVLGELTALQALAIGANRLTGSIPSQLGKLKSVKWMWLYDNRLTSSLPSELGNLSGLSLFHAFVNQLTGTFPSEFGKLTGMTDFQVFNTLLSGEIPAEFGNLSNLKTLSVHGTQLTGGFPVATCQLASAQQLAITADCNEMVCC